MFLQTNLRFFAKTMITQFLIERENDPYLKISQTRRIESVSHSHFIWITGFQFRYSHMAWPDYSKGFKRKKWNKRNDSIYVPYGSLPRGEYQYRFALYDSLWTGNLTKETVRLKKEWPEEHSILYGDFVDYALERNLYFKPTQKLNSAIIQLYINPVVKIPLPGHVEIAFTHLDQNMNNPVCVYWQVVEDYHKEIVPPRGYWSNYGMSVKLSNISITVCHATHYGAYALLMEPIRPDVSEPISTLDLLTIILSIISIIMLVSFVIAMAMLECYETIQCRIYIYIAISMCFANLFFLVGFFTRTDFDSCTTMMTLMELSFMSVFTWFMVDAIHQLNKIVPLFNPKTNVDAFFIIIGLGLPTSVLIAMLEFPYPAFTELTYCWPYVSGIEYLYFIVPIATVLLVTAIIRVMTFGKVRNDEKKMLSNMNYIRALIGIRATSVTLTTCIVYSVLGTIGIKQSGDVIQVIQLILPIIQIIISGQMIHFFFRRNDEVIDALEEQKKILERMRMNKMDHLAGVYMDVKYIPNPSDKDGNVITESVPNLQKSTVKNTFKNGGSNISLPEDFRMDLTTSETDLIR